MANGGRRESASPSSLMAFGRGKREKEKEKGRKIYFFSLVGIIRVWHQMGWCEELVKK